MRIISQYLTSFPIEQIFIAVDDNRLWAKLVGSNETFCLGEYKTCERAKEVFHAIHSHYENVPLLKDLKAVYRQRSFEMPEE